MRHTAVPDFVSAPNFSHTNKYFPPALACARSTSKLPRLHSTVVASSPRPEISNITSGVRPVHQFGGSTFVTMGELSVSDAARDSSAPRIAEQQDPAKHSRVRNVPRASRHGSPLTGHQAFPEIPTSQTPPARENSAAAYASAARPN